MEGNFNRNPSRRGRPRGVRAGNRIRGRGRGRGRPQRGRYNLEANFDPDFLQRLQNFEGYAINPSK